MLDTVINMLIICGDVLPNPGSVDIDSKICNTLADFKNKIWVGYYSFEYAKY